jgi:hypothetical protein
MCKLCVYFCKVLLYVHTLVEFLCAIVRLDRRKVVYISIEYFEYSVYVRRSVAEFLVLYVEIAG